MEHEIKLIPLALEVLAKVKDQREQQGLRQRIEKLKVLRVVSSDIKSG